ncbi:MAG: hypothetical protein HYX77_01560, partial [Acidobacteria bacterium]|nr:hypothetical protein [Acidobacteriota bacterium]
GFLQHNFRELSERFGVVVASAFRGFPSYPQRYIEVLEPQPPPPAEIRCRVEPLKVPRVTTSFTEDDLVMREFLPSGSRQLIREGALRAA